MGMVNIKNELWALQIIALLKTKLVTEGICNPNVVPSAQGDKCHIVGAGEVTVSDTEQDTDIEYQDPADTDTEFTYNVDKKFALIVHDKDVKQAAIPWQALYADRGAYGLVKALDASVFADHASAGLDSYETGTTAWQLGTSGADVPALFAALAKQLDDADAPDAGRFVVLPSIGVQAVRLYMAGKNTNWGDKVTENGVVGDFMGFTIHKSNNLTTAAGVIHGLAGIKGDGIAWKTQIDANDIEALRSEGRFATLVRGRCLAGHKVYRPSIVVDLNLNSTLLA